MKPGFWLWVGLAAFHVVAGVGGSGLSVLLAALCGVMAGRASRP